MTEEKKPREWGCMTGTTHVYAVEARAKFGAIVYRLACWNGPWLYEQPFFALNPHEYKKTAQDVV